MCSIVLQIIYIAGVVVAGGLTIAALVTPAWTAGATGNFQNSGSLISNCISNINQCQDTFQNLSGYQLAAAVLLILVILVCVAALIWALFTCCACCCHACLFPMFPIFTGAACAMEFVAILVYALNIPGLTTSNIGYSMWISIGATIILAVDTVLAIFLCECCALCP